MKTFILTIFLIGTTSNIAESQWRDWGLWNPAAFGVHDTNFFASRLDGGVYRHGHSPFSGWTEADTGIDPVYHVTAFASIGPYLIVDAGYRSTNLGSSWMPMNHLKFLPSCFATMGGLVFSGGIAGSGVWRSIDSGEDWAAAYSGLTNMNVNALAALNTTLFAGTTGGVYVSTDSGENWEPTSITTFTTSLAVIGSIIVAGQQDGGIYRSKDGGNTWSPDVTGLTNGYISSIVTDGRYFFAGSGLGVAGQSYCCGGGVYVSTDTGSSWDTVSTGLPWLSVSTLCVFDTLLVAGVWTDDHQMSYTYVRPISEMVNPKSAVREMPQPSDTIAIYPNPASGAVTIFAGGTSIYGVRVRNVLGEDVMDIPNVRESELSIDLSKLPSGTYFLQIETEIGVALRKVIRK